MRRVCAALLAVSALAFAGAACAETAHVHPEPEVLAPGYSELEFTPPAVGSYELPALGDAADGAVLDSDGQTRRLHNLLGDKVTVLSFIYTTCSDVNGCPLATHVLKGVQNKVIEDPALHGEVRLISMSFDPERDTPRVLDAYGSYFRADGFDWQFLTTRSAAELDPILAAYDQTVIRDYDAEGNALGTLSHILRVLLIDQDRRVRNIYSTSFLHADTVANDIRTVLAAARETTGSPH